jgi:glycosyltransferase involved in cell wall biosynthesis
MNLVRPPSRSLGIVAHIGIWIELPPGATLLGEGIGQLVRLIVENACGRDIKCTFFAPFWLHNTMDRYLEDFEPTARKLVRVQYTRRLVPLLWRFSGHATARRPRKRKLRPTWLNWRPIARRMAQLFVPQAPPTAMLTALVALPAILIFSPLIAASLGFVWLRRRLARLFSKGRLLLRHVRNRYGRIAYELIREDEYERLVRTANRRTDIDCWFVPNPGWSTAAKLRGPKVCLFPDFVFAEHWTGFAAQDIANVRERFRALAQSNPYYVCFSHYVMEAHARRCFGIPQSRLSLIHHAPILYEAPVDSDARKALLRYLAERFTQEKAFTAIEQNHIYPYLRSLDLSNLRYIFVSTQLRPYKNVFRLAQAVERLIRYHHVDIKLVLTGTLDFVSLEPELAKFIQTNALWFDILSIPRVPKHVHALLYRFAAITVHPSFFEGGFPFVFGESVGLGTPCLLARNAATSEVLSTSELRSFTFDPYLSPRQLAIVLMQSMERRESMLVEQTAMLKRMSVRTWQEVTSEYLSLFATAATEARNPRSRYVERYRVVTPNKGAA